MYKGDSLYRITSVGRKIVKGARSYNRNEVLDFIYPGGTASVESVAAHCFGGDGMRARMALRRLERKGLVEDLAGKRTAGGVYGSF